MWSAGEVVGVVPVVAALLGIQRDDWDHLAPAREGVLAAPLVSRRPAPVLEFRTRAANGPAQKALAKSSLVLLAVALPLRIAGILVVR